MCEWGCVCTCTFVCVRVCVYTYRHGVSSGEDDIYFLAN